MKLLREFDEEKNIYTIIDNCNLNITTYDIETLGKLLEKEEIKGCSYKKGSLIFKEVLEAKRLLEKGISNSGLNMMITKYLNKNEVFVKFEDGFETKTSYSNFKRGKVANPNYFKNKYVGESNIANNGMLMTIIDYKSYHNIIVEFADGYKVETNYPCFKRGEVANPNIFRNKYLGEQNRANNGMMMTIIGYKNYHNITVRFEDGFETTVTYASFKNGEVANPNILKNKYLGETNTANNGMLMTIIDYRNSRDITVRFEDGYETDVNYGNFKRGKVSNPNILKNKYEGESILANNGMMMTIIEYRNYNDVTVRFEDGFEVVTCYGSFKNGEVANLNYSKNRHIGEQSIANNGMMMTIVEYRNNKDITIEFEDGYRTDATYTNFKNGEVANPFKVNKNRSTCEKIVAFYLGKFVSYIPSFKASWLGKGMEYDLFINDRIAIEYDGLIYHNLKVESDEMKNILTAQNSDKVHKLIRIREKGLPELGYNEQVVNFTVEKYSKTSRYFKSLENCIKDILRYLNLDFNEDEIIVDKELYEFCKSEEFLKTENICQNLELVA